MKSKYVIIFLLFILLAAVSGFLYFQKRKNTPAALACRGCNVIFIGFDSLQAAHVHHLGYPRETTPTLDRLAGEGFSFSQAISPASWTVPGFMSVFTSTFPSVHKVVNRWAVYTKTQKIPSNLKKLSPNIKTITEIMKDHGYRTGGFTGDAGVSGAIGYNQGFEVYTDEKLFGGMDNSLNHTRSWLDQHKGEKFFMFFHGYDVHGQFDIASGYQSPFAPQVYHGPYKGTKAEQAKLREEGLKNGAISLTAADVAFWRAWYDGKIRDADARLGAFIEELSKRGLLDHTVIVLFADHGTEFYEHKRFDHGYTLYDELVRVPLIIRIPGVRGGRIISQQVSTLDVVPAILEILGLNPGEPFKSQMQGQSLVSLLTDTKRPGHDVFIETDYRNYTHKRAIRTDDGWKFILTLESGQEELYSLKPDPQEQNNLIGTERKKADEFREKLFRHLAQTLHTPVGQPLSSQCLPVYPGQCPL